MVNEVELMLDCKCKCQFI